MSSYRVYYKQYPRIAEVVRSDIEDIETFAQSLVTKDKQPWRIINRATDESLQLGEYQP